MPLGDLGVYFAFRVVEFLVQRFPVDTCLSAADGCGILMYHLLPFKRATAERNIRRVYPKLSEEEVTNMICESYQYVCKGIVVIANINHFRDNLRQYVQVGDRDCDTDDGLAIPAQLQRDLRQGVILVSGHFGAWELMSAIFDPLHLPVLKCRSRTQVYQPLHNQYLHRHMLKLRAEGPEGRRGEKLELVAHQPKLMNLLESRLNQGGVVGLVADQRPSLKKHSEVSCVHLSIITMTISQSYL